MAKISINLKEASVDKKNIIVGIDLGTTNSLIAYIDDSTQQATVIQGKDKDALVPSIIHFDQENKIQVGKDAKPYLISDTANTIFSVKRLLGKSYQDIQNHESIFSYKIIDNEDQLVKIQVGNIFYTPIELSSFILKELKTRAENHLQETITQAVITVPAYFNDAQRQATRNAGKLAGLDVLRIINEPTAASLAYGIGLHKDDQKTVVVYDLGGGTFDVSILKIESGVFEVLATHGDTFLGGDDFDKVVFDFLLRKYSLELNHSETQEFRMICENIKKQINDESVFSFEYKNVKIEITLDEFKELVHPIIEKTISSCQQAMSDAQLRFDEIDEVLLVGGSTRLLQVREEVEKYFHKKPLTSLHPDEAVALGAAIQADILAGNNKELLLLDITPLSLGIETMGGLMDVLIPRNSKVPCRASRQYTTSKDGQTGMIVTVYQGERELVDHNRKLASFTLQGIPAMPAGLPKVDIYFTINADGILTVTAQELRSGVVQEIEVQPQSGLTDAEVEKRLLDSIQNAQDDMQERALKEAIQEAEQMIYTTQNFLAKNSSLLSEDEISKTKNKIDTLAEAIKTSQDKNQIHQAIEALNTYTQPFAERVMDHAIADALKGKSIIS